MPTILERLASGQRWWAAELVLRPAGLCCLAAAVALAFLVHRRIIAPPPHDPAPLDFLTCLGAVILLSLGLALAIEGPGLFRRVPRPPRALLP